MDRDTPCEDQRLRAFLERGTEIAGNLAGVGIGFLVGGPPGAFLGAVAPPLVATTIDAMHRQLSQREQSRTAGVAIVAAARIRRNLDLGREARADGFFQGAPGHRSVAEELMEGVLISAQREHEEKKIPYLGSLLANLAFAEGINRAEANLLLRMADRLSYRQICLLALFGRKKEFPGLRGGDFQDQFRDPIAVKQEGIFDLVGLLEEAEELIANGMLTQETRVIFARGEGLNPASAELWRWGALLYDLMDLGELPAADLHPLAAALS
jgi:hypothetical protein